MPKAHTEAGRTAPPPRRKVLRTVEWALMEGIIVRLRRRVHVVDLVSIHSRL